MPTSRRIASTFLRSEVSSIPATMMRPCWCSSSRLMQRIIVDLPDPDGPQTTTFSPLPTTRLMSFRTWNSPYHLFTDCSAIMVSPCDVTSGAVSAARLIPGSPLLCRSASPALIECTFEHLAIARHEKAEAEIDRRRKDVSLDGKPLPGRIGQCCIGGAEQVEEADDD